MTMHLRLVSTGRHDAAIQAAARSLGLALSTDAVPSRGLVLDLPLGQALQEARDRDAGTAVLAIVTADEADAALGQLGLVLDDVLVLPGRPGELEGRLRQIANSAVGDQRSRTLRLVAHDVNNPLTAIRLLAEMLAMDMTSDDTRQDMQDILEASDLAAALIESLSGLARLDAAPGGEEGGIVDLAALLNDACRRPSMRDHARVQPAGAAVPVSGSSASVKQALGDLVLNARRLSETREPFTASASAQGQYGVVEVHMPQVDLAPEHHDAMLRPYGALAPRDARIQVAPAGLAHAARVARSAGGTLDIETTSSGLTFRLRMPLHASR